MYRYRGGEREFCPLPCNPYPFCDINYRRMNGIPKEQIKKKAIVHENFSENPEKNLKKSIS
jgi:hypothetical protein